MATTYAIRTAVLMPMLPAAQLPAAPLCGSALSGLGASVAGTRVRTGLVSSITNERHVAVIGTSQVVTPVIGSGVNGSVFDGVDVVPALRTWRPPV